MEADFHNFASNPDRGFIHTITFKLLKSNTKNLDMKIEDKPIYCHAWTSNISSRVMCNSIPCCGYSIHGEHPKLPLKGFKDIDKIGRHQAPYYNDMRKEKSNKNPLKR